MSAAGEPFQHVTGIVGRARFAEDAAFEGDLGVGTDDDGRACGARGNEFGFGDRQTFNEDMGRFARVRRFVNGGGHHSEGKAGVAQDFGAADGSGSEDELHGRDLSIVQRFTVVSCKFSVRGAKKGFPLDRVTPEVYGFRTCSTRNIGFSAPT